MTTPELLEDLLAQVVDDAKGDDRRRTERAAADLRRCADATLPSAEVDPAATMLALVLPCFLEQEEWQGDDDEDRRLRMRLVLQLAGLIRRLPDREWSESGSATVRLARAWRSALDRLRGAGVPSGG